MPKTLDYFVGKTVIITGAASGIGRATALVFAREHANVVCADINEVGARETAAQVNGKGSRALALTVDVTARKQVNDMAERAIDPCGSLQFMFNSAGADDPSCKISEEGKEGTVGSVQTFFFRAEDRLWSRDRLAAWPPDGNGREPPAIV